MAQPARRLRAQHPTILLSFLAGLGLLALSAWAAYPEAPEPPATEFIRTTFLDPPQLPPSFEDRWQAAGLAPDEGMEEAPVVFFEWANPEKETPVTDEGLIRLAFAEEGTSSPFDAVFNVRKDPLAFAASSASEERCLASAIYFEARGEDRIGRLAVAQVILNRVRDPAYPKTICGVVYQNADSFRRCQFSFACDGRSDRVADMRSWSEAVKVARQALANSDQTLVADLDHAMFYHAVSVSPRWAAKMRRTDTIGRHIFYERVSSRS